MLLLSGASGFLCLGETASSVAVHAQGRFTPIYEIQGTGASSPIVDMRVDTVGLVTGVALDGFYLQDPSGDGDPRTSDGIFVFTYSAPGRLSPHVGVGACIVVRDALVQEYYGKTELSWVGGVEPSDVCPAAPIAVAPLPDLPLGADPVVHYERLEGMLVRLGELDGFVHGPTKRYALDEAEIAYLPSRLQPAVQYERILRQPDDAGASPDYPWAGHSLQYLSNLLGGDLPVAKWGDRLRGGQDGDKPLFAVLDYNFGKYQQLLLPGQSLTVVRGPAPPEDGLATSPTDFTVCTFNVHGLGHGTEQYVEDAAYEQALGLRARMIAGPMQGCTIVGLQETGTGDDAEALAARLVRDHGLPYAAIAENGPMSSDAGFPLTNSFLVRTDRVEVVGWDSVQACSENDYGVRTAGDECPAGRYPLFNRPPLVLDVLVHGEWGDPLALRLVDNHWKSKSGDEEANSERRMLQAEHVGAIVRESQKSDDAPNVIVLGDLNDFEDSPPLRELTEASAGGLGFVNVWDLLSATDRYSFVFNGVSQLLDHILIPPTMVQSLSGVDALHVAADYGRCESGVAADVLATGRSAPCQVSDHDPLMIRLRPAGAAALGGELGYPGIRVEAVHVESGERFAVVTDRGGGYRLWGLPPGELRIRYVAPEWLIVDEADLTVEAPTGLTMLAAPDIRLVSAIQAADAVSTLAADEPLTTTGAP